MVDEVFDRSMRAQDERVRQEEAKKQHNKEIVKETLHHQMKELAQKRNI